MNSELYKELYKFEWDQRTHLISAVNIPIVVLTALGTVAVSMAIGYPYTESVEAWTFSGFLLISVVTLGVGLVFVIVSLLMSAYEKIPSPMRLRTHFEQLCQWHVRNGSSREAARRSSQRRLTCIWREPLRSMDSRTAQEETAYFSLALLYAWP
jgi:hypothetical protein